MSLQHITCITCPRGCSLEVDVEAQTVTGNSCPRGAVYGLAEATNPVRTVTSTVRVVDADGEFVDMEPVRTAKPIPKGLMFAAMKEIDAVRANKPIRRGDVLIPNPLHTGVDVIAARDLL